MKDFKLLKKDYGESFAHFCRSNFPELFENDCCYDIVSKMFAPSKTVFEDLSKDNMLDDFVIYVQSIYISLKMNNKLQQTELTPKELLDKAGYDFYEVLDYDGENGLNSFKKYYKNDELLCSFNYFSRRLSDAYVFFAVKKNVDEIKRENFDNPKREDEYGTSVISIQFSKGEYNFLSIKNRYNHTVDNPDATFFNNLDLIIPGLTYAFYNHYNLKLPTEKCNLFYLRDYELGADNRLYKVNLRENYKFYCVNNIVLMGANRQVFPYDKNKYLVFDKYILDLEKKKILNINDSFTLSLGEFEKIDIYKKDSSSKVIVFIDKNGQTVEVTINKSNKIIEYKNNHITKIGDDFLNFSKNLQKIEANNLVSVGNNFIHKNEYLRKIDLPSLKYAGDNFVMSCKNIEKINLPSLEDVGHNFLCYPAFVNGVNLPNLRRVGNNFMFTSVNLYNFLAENLESVGDNFLGKALKLNTVTLPSLRSCGANFMEKASLLSSLSLPNIKNIGKGFLLYVQNLKEIDIHNAERVEKNFMPLNTDLKDINLPKTKFIDERFLSANASIKNVFVPKLRVIEKGFLECAGSSLEKIDISSVEYIDPSFYKVLEKTKNAEVSVKNNKDTIKLIKKLTKNNINLIIEKQEKNNSLTSKIKKLNNKVVNTLKKKISNGKTKDR